MVSWHLVSALKPWMTEARSYEDFMMAYERLLKEIERRQSVTMYHATIANQYNQQLAALHDGKRAVERT